MPIACIYHILLIWDYCMPSLTVTAFPKCKIKGSSVWLSLFSMHYQLHALYEAVDLKTIKCATATSACYFANLPTLSSACRLLGLESLNSVTLWLHKVKTAHIRFEWTRKKEKHMNCWNEIKTCSTYLEHVNLWERCWLQSCSNWNLSSRLCTESDSASLSY